VREDVWGEKGRREEKVARGGREVEGGRERDERWRGIGRVRRESERRVGRWGGGAGGRRRKMVNGGGEKEGGRE